MTCRELSEFILDYLSGELPEPVRGAFDHHLSLCPNCRRYLVGYRETVALGRRAFDDESAPLPADVPEDLVHGILASRRRG